MKKTLFIVSLLLIIGCNTTDKKVKVFDRNNALLFESSEGEYQVSEGYANWKEITDSSGSWICIPKEDFNE